MKPSESTTSARERLCKSNKKNEALALILAAIGAISASVSAGCEPFVIAYGRQMTFDEYNEKYRKCRPLKRKNGTNDISEFDKCMMRRD